MKKGYYEWAMAVKHVFFIIFLVATFMGCAKETLNDETYYRVYREIVKVAVESDTPDEVEAKNSKIFKKHGITYKEFKEYGKKLLKKDAESYLEKIELINREVGRK